MALTVRTAGLHLLIAHAEAGPAGAYSAHLDIVYFTGGETTGYPVPGIFLSGEDAIKGALLHGTKIVNGEIHGLTPPADSSDEPPLETDISGLDCNQLPFIDLGSVIGVLIPDPTRGPYVPTGNPGTLGTAGDKPARPPTGNPGTFEILDPTELGRLASDAMKFRLLGLRRKP